MILKTEEILILYKHIGYGPVNSARIIVFGNEPGIAGGTDLENTISKLMFQYQTRDLLNIGGGFSMIEIDPSPVSSVFVQFIARLMLALKYKDERFFDELSSQGRTFLNNYIMNNISKDETAIINLRPFPRATERTWEYDNVSEKDYNKRFNFTLKRPLNDDLKEMRIDNLKEAFRIAKHSLIIGSGDRENKKKFFELIYPGIEFQEIIFEKLKIYYSPHPKIILCNYFDNRSGIRLAGLKQIYKIIINSNLLG